MTIGTKESKEQKENDEIIKVNNSIDTCTYLIGIVAMKVKKLKRVT